jgi:hypothetical protein
VVQWDDSGGKSIMEYAPVCFFKQRAPKVSSIVGEQESSRGVATEVTSGRVESPREGCGIP